MILLIFFIVYRIIPFLHMNTCIKIPQFQTLPQNKIWKVDEQLQSLCPTVIFTSPSQISDGRRISLEFSCRSTQWRTNTHCRAEKGKIKIRSISAHSWLLQAFLHFLPHFQWKLHLLVRGCSINRTLLQCPTLGCSHPCIYILMHIYLFRLAILSYQ